MKFRGSITQRLISLSTLRSGGRPPPRKTRFRLLAKLCRVGLVTHKAPMKGFEVVVFTSSPPFPSFLGAMTVSSTAIQKLPYGKIGLRRKNRGATWIAELSAADRDANPAGPGLAQGELSRWQQLPAPSGSPACKRRA